MKIKPYPEKHMKGVVEITEPDDSRVRNIACDFGIQIATDGRVWICIDGKAFVRFKPALKE